MQFEIIIAAEGKTVTTIPVEVQEGDRRIENAIAQFYAALYEGKHVRLTATEPVVDMPSDMGRRIAANKAALKSALKEVHEHEVALAELRKKGASITSEMHSIINDLRAKVGTLTPDEVAKLEDELGINISTAESDDCSDIDSAKGIEFTVAMTHALTKRCGHDKRLGDLTYMVCHDIGYRADLIVTSSNCAEIKKGLIEFLKDRHGITVGDDVLDVITGMLYTNACAIGYIK